MEKQPNSLSTPHVPAARHQAKGAQWNAGWHPIPRAQVQTINQRLEDAAVACLTQKTKEAVAEKRKIYDCLRAPLEVAACIEFPTGELCNAGISGFVWLWVMAGIISSPYTPEESKSSSFACQGLEGLIRIENIPLTTALLTAKEINIYRVAVSISEPWVKFAPKVRAAFRRASRMEQDTAESSASRADL